MLGKLIKNDFIASSHSVFGIYLAALIIGAVTVVSYLSDVTWIIALSTIALLVVSIGIIVVTLFTVVMNFNKTLYGNQGYLSFTLPVKSSQLLLSKTIVSFVWILLSYIMAIGIIVGIVMFFKAKIGEEMIESITLMLQMIASFPSTGVILQVVIALAVYFFATILILIAQVFFSITISNIRPFQQMGMIGGILMFFIVYVLTQSISAYLTSNIPLSLIINTEGLSIQQVNMIGSAGTGGTVIGLAGFIFQILVAVGMFIGTNHLMKKKINLK